MVFSSWLYARSVFCPLIISSTKPFSSPSFAERLRNRGRVKPVIFFVMNIESGTVKTNTSTSVGEMESIMMSAPMTVTALANTCTMSFVSEVLMVSMSYEIRLKMSPVWCVSKYPTGSSLSFWNTSCRIVFTTRRLMTIIRRVSAYESAADTAYITTIRTP